MYRMVFMSGVWYGIKIKSVEDDLELINDFVGSGDIVAICDDVGDFAEAVDILLEDIVEVN